MQVHDAIETLYGLRPNTRLNIRSPWKGDRRVARQWCPLHEGRWVRLLVRADESDEAVFHCEGGCAQEQIEARLKTASAWSKAIQPVDADEVIEGRAWLWNGCARGRESEAER